MSRKIWLFPLILIGLIFIAPAAMAQSPEVRLSLTPSANTLTVGDPVQLTLRAVYPADYTLTIPPLEQAWGPFDVRGQSPAETETNADGTKITTQIIEVTLFDVGVFQTPELVLTLQSPGGETLEYVTPPIALTVQSVLAEDDLTPRDLKPQAELSAPPLWPWLLGGLLLAIVIAGAGWFLLRKLTQQFSNHPAEIAVQPVIDNRLPYEIALAELVRIEQLDLPGQGRCKEHYSLVSDCQRTYLQAVYHIPAMDWTTAEISAGLRQNGLHPQIANQFVTLLADTDLVKFARFSPPEAEARAIVPRARQVILQTAVPPTPEVTA